MDLKKLIREVLENKDCCTATKPIKAPILNEGMQSRVLMTENMQYHIDNKKPLYETTLPYGSKEYLDLWVEARYLYSRGALNVEGIDICGKTGTAENFAKINGKRVKLQDHSIFVAFAPKDNPKIAIAVFVENGYWGSRWAGPITSLMIEKYIKKKIKRTDLEKRMLEGSLQGEYNKYYANPIIDTLIKTKIEGSVKPIVIKPAVKGKVAPEN